MAEILTNASNLDARYSEFNAIAGGQQNNRIAGDQHIHIHNPPTQRSERDQLLATLNPVDSRNSYPEPCIDGTRRTIFAEIDRWATQTNKKVPNILLLTGSPGAGKSAIASSLVSKWRREKKLGATFAFKHSDAALSNPAAMWRSVAFDLANFDPKLGDVVVEALKKRTLDTTPTGADIRLHFECIIEPMKRTPYHKPVFIVIDALDECGRDDLENVATKRRVLLDTLAMFQRFPPNFKLVVTSRDERLSETFRNVCQHMTLHTGDAVTPETSLDIEHFFRTHFSEVHGLEVLVDQRVYAKLTAQAAGLFIWAETVVKFLNQKGAFPAQLLQLIMDDRFVKDPVYNLYKDILEISF